VKPLPIKGKILIAAAVASGLAVFVKAMLGSGQVHDYPKFLAYLLVSVAATRLRVSLPRMTSSMSVNLPFILIALIELSLPEALLITAVSTFVQSFWPESRQRNLVQVAFNVSVLVLAAQSTWLALRFASHNLALAIVSGALTVLLANTLPVAAIIGITEAGHVARIWMHIVELTFPYYGIAAGIAGLVKLAAYAIGWQVPLLILPAMLLVYRSYKFCFQHMSGSAPVPQARSMAAGAGAH
jgi:uncharacterized membrane-anchored protein YitT (DUF2179 family)